MKDELDYIHKALAEYKKTRGGLDIRLRNDLSRIVATRLHELGWTQARLAKASELTEALISRVIHSDANCELSTIAAVCHALGVKPRLRVDGEPIAPPFGETSPNYWNSYDNEDTSEPEYESVEIAQGACYQAEEVFRSASGVGEVCIQS